MADLKISYDSNVLVGFDRADDAGVYRLSDDLALVQTVDFFTPIVDDPYDFGRITAANALSDVYAMGGRPLTALNLVAFPLNTFSLDILTAILNGGLSVMKEAGVQLLGGHSIDDSELKYGLSVTGLIHPARIWRNNGMHDGDVLVLTKPLGTGIVGTAIKAGMCDKLEEAAAIKSMADLNRRASEILYKYTVHACTDVTGFGLAGHLREMMADDKFCVEIDSKSLPVLPGVKNYADTGLVPGGLYRNRDFYMPMCAIDSTVDELSRDIIFDPQTSGGLLVSIPAEEGKLCVEEMRREGIAEAGIIARVKGAETQFIRVV